MRWRKIERLDVYFNKSLNVIFSTLFKVFSPIEKYLIKHERDSRFLYPPPIFIVGCPRSGTTILYQLISNYFDILYPTNFTSFFFKSLYIGTRINNCFFKNTPHNTFVSKEGKSFKINAPHELGKFWYQWFPRNKYFISEEEYSYKDLLGIRKTFLLISKYFKKSIIIKNVSLGQRLQILHKILPETLIIFVRRNPFFTSQSILKHREMVLGSKEKWWATEPSNSEALKSLPYPEQIVKQVYFLEQQIEKDIQLFPINQILKINYEDFLGNLPENLNIIKDFWTRNNLKVKLRSDAIIPNLNVENKITASPDDVKAFINEIEKLDWPKWV